MLPSLILALLLAACAAAPGAGPVQSATRPALSEQSHTDRLVTLPRPPILSADDAAAVPLARLNAERTRWDELYARNEAETVTVDALPFLLATAEGRRFLAARRPRAIARGLPAERCPKTVAWAPAAAAALPDLVEGVLQRCIAALAPDHPGCGCQVLAIDDRLTVPRQEVGYATGTTARLLIPERGVDRVLVAEEDPSGLLLRDLLGPVARLQRPAEGRVRVAFLRGGGSYEGRSIPVGYRRGRVAERIYATGPAGERLRLLVGFSPDELEEGAAGWLAWSPGA